MSYVSGFMMGAAIGKSLHQMFFGGPARQAVPRLANPMPGATARVRAAGSRVYARAGELGERAAAEVFAAGFHLEHTLPGRRRYRARLTPELAELLNAQLAKLTFLKEVKVNATTGSLLFVFDPKDEAKMDLVADFLRDSIFRNRFARKALDAAMPLEAHAGALTKSVRGTVRDFSGWIKSSTNGWLDISSLAFLLFLFRGLRKFILTRQYPTASQMLWWAVSMMRGWRTV